MPRFPPRPSPPPTLPHLGLSAGRATQRAPMCLLHPRIPLRALPLAESAYRLQGVRCVCIILAAGAQERAPARIACVCAFHHTATVARLPRVHFGKATTHQDTVLLWDGFWEAGLSDGDELHVLGQ